MCAEACHFYVATGEAEVHADQQARACSSAPISATSARSRRCSGSRPRAKSTLDELETWQELIFDSCTLCGRCTLVCPMGIDIAELIKEARHGMFKAGPGAGPAAADGPHRARLGQPGDAGATTSPTSSATPASEHGVEMHVDLDKADYLVTVAPAELTEHTKALADAAKILNRIGASWTYAPDGFEASNIGFINGDIDLQETMTRRRSTPRPKIGAHTLILPECGHAYGAARWEAAT